MSGRTNLSAYARWQLVDYVSQRGILSFVIGFMLGAPVRYVVHAMRSAGAGADGLQSDADKLTASTAATLGVLIVLLAVQRSVAGDRTDGYYRFYFSKPVRIWEFYLQRYAIFGAGLLAMVLLLLMVGRVAGVPLHPAGALEYFLILYIALGGLGFLCSAITRYDWSAMAVIWFGALLVRTMYAGETSGWRHVIASVLPRADLADNVRGALFRGEAPDAHAVAWLVGYGLMCILVGTLIIQRRPLAS